MPGTRIEFNRKPDDFDEFMERFIALKRIGDGRWEWPSRLGDMTVTARDDPQGRFMVIVESDTALHIPWERANTMARKIYEHYRDQCRYQLF